MGILIIFILLFVVVPKTDFLNIQVLHYYGTFPNAVEVLELLRTQQKQIYLLVISGVLHNHYFRNLKQYLKYLKQCVNCFLPAVKQTGLSLWERNDQVRPSRNDQARPPRGQARPLRNDQQLIIQLTIRAIFSSRVSEPILLN